LGGACSTASADLLWDVDAGSLFHRLPISGTRAVVSVSVTMATSLVEFSIA